MQYGAVCKVVGATFYPRGQDLLERVCGIEDEENFKKEFSDQNPKPVQAKECFFERSFGYEVLLIKETENEFDENAIRVDMKMTDGHVTIGYIPKELTTYISPAIDITYAFISRIRYRPTFQREGFYPVLNLISTEPWAKQIIAAGRGVS